MKNITRILSLILLVAAFAFPAAAQTVLTPTTLSSAITSTASGPVGFILSVTSATGFVASTTVMIVDAEAMKVTAVNGTQITVVRGQSGTRVSTHNSGALVWIGTFNQLGFSDSKQGSCTRSNEPVLPHISILNSAGNAVTIYDCHGGQWVNGGGASYASVNNAFKVVSPPVGGVLYTGINTNGTAPSASTLYCSEVDLPNMLITNVGALAGTTVATDKWYYILYDASGALLANSAVAGVTTATATVFQNQALTTPYYATAGRYFACLASNGTTDTVRMSVTGQMDTVLTTSRGTSTFGTLYTPLTIPTTFTSAVGPVFNFN